MGSQELCAQDVISNSGEGRRGDSTRPSTGEEPQRPISVQFQGPEEEEPPRTVVPYRGSEPGQAGSPRLELGTKKHPPRSAPCYPAANSKHVI